MQEETKILFITDIHQNLEGIGRLDFSSYDMIICGGDILDPKAPDLGKALKIIELLPERTYIVPGNCDTDPGLLKLMEERLQQIHLKQLPLKDDLSIAGVGYCRSLVRDLKAYRAYFLEDRKRIFSFSKVSRLSFILDFIGIKLKDGELNILSEEEALEQSSSFRARFKFFDEERLKEFFTSIKGLEGGILLSHSPPLGALDRLDGLPHAGSSLIAEAIERHSPGLVLCGHFHELAGRYQEEKGPLYFNPGAFNENRAGVISYKEGLYRVKQINI